MPKKSKKVRHSQEENKVAMRSHPIRKASRHHMMRQAERMMLEAQDSVDIGYIKTLLFPELYNADIPQPMSTQSYCRFTDKKEITIRSNGQGLILWYPKTNVGPQLFIRHGNIDQGYPFAIAEQAAYVSNGADWKAGGWQDYSDYFTQTSLVAGQLSIQYIGQLQNEQGYMVASQLYGIAPNDVTSQDIENGQFRCLAKPGDGIRQVYIPKGLDDFSYYPTTVQKDNNGVVSTITTRNNGRGPGGVISQLVFPYDTTKGPNSWINAVAPPEVLTGGKYKETKFLFDDEADCLAIYWKGLALEGGSALSSQDLRIDITRRFNGFPTASQRDILDLIKPRKIFDSKKTIDVVNELQMAIPQIAGHSLKQMDRVSDQIQEFLPNLGHLYNEGMLKEGSTLEAFSQQLQQLSGNEGAPTSIGRIYE